MKFFNDCADHELSFCSLMTHSFPAEELDAETRSRVEEAARVFSVELRGVFVYSSAAEDDVDSFVLATPGGFAWVLSSEAAKAGPIELRYFARQADADASEFGPETSVDVLGLNQKAKENA